jgi:hypothetical protein
MNRKQLIVLLVLVVVVGGAGLLLRSKQAASWQGGGSAAGKKVFDKFPINDVARLTIKQGTNELNLVRKEDWRVRERNDYPANYSELSDFLIKVSQLKVVQSEKVGPSQLPKLGLEAGSGSNAATVVEFHGADGKLLRSLLLGKKHLRKSNRPSPFGEMGDEGWPDGRYVKAGADAGDVVLVSESFSNIEPKPEQWINKDFFKIEKPRSISVAFPAATNSWKLTRETENGDWKLAEAKPGEQLDSSKVSGFSSALSSPSFNDVLMDPKPEALGLDKPTVITIQTFDDFTYTVNAGHKTNENYSLTVVVAAQLPKERTPGKDEKPEDKEKLDKEFKEKQKKLEEKLTLEKSFEKWTYTVSGWTLDSLLKQRAELMAEKKEEPKTDAGTNQPPAAAAAPAPAPATNQPPNAADTPSPPPEPAEQ